MKIQTVLVSGVLVLTSVNGVLAHSTPKEKPEKPTVEVVTPQAVPSEPSGAGPEADTCQQPRPECRNVTMPGARRAAVVVKPIYPAPFLPSVIVAHVTRDFGGVVRVLIHGQPAIRTFSVGQPRPKCCNAVVPQQPKKPSVVREQPKIQLPYGK